MEKWQFIKKEDLGKESSIPLEIMDNDEEVYYEIARIMFDEIKANNEKGKNTVFICPVGPVGQYKKFVRMVNMYKISLEHVYIFNMDEYLDDDKKLISKENPLSFKGFMEREVYSQIDESLNVPVENRFFPEPGNESFIWEKISELGGVDICFGGVGINGHLAFNEPPEEEVSVEKFENYSTRVLEISRETRTINSVSATGGCISAMPKWCVTIGMKEILSSRKIVIGMFRDWHRGVLRELMHGPVTSKVPASLLQNHPNAKLYVTSLAAEEPIKKK